MLYLQDKQFARKKKKNAWVFGLALFLFILLFFHKSIFNSLYSLSENIGARIWPYSNSLKNDQSIFKTNASLLNENNYLRDQLEELNAKLADNEILSDENLKLKEILGRKEDKNFILGAILTKPNQSVFDTLIVDIGSDAGIREGERVFAYGNILIGQVSEVFAKTSRVKLFSSPGQKVDVILSGKDIYAQALGRGGQNFEITLPRDAEVVKGAEVALPGMTTSVLGIIEEIISDPRDPFQKVLLRSPINIQELKFVQIESTTAK